MKKVRSKFSGLWLITFSVFLLATSLNAQERQGTLSEDAKAKIVERISLLLNESYVFPDVAKKVEVHLKARLKEGAFDTITRKRSFATVMTKELQTVSHDKHMRVRVRSAPVVKTDEEDPILDDIFQKEIEATKNSGYMKVEILPGNIGYLDLRGFAPVETGKETASAAMLLLSNTYSIIVDLRKNGGGSPAMVQYLCSYFFDEPTHLNSLYWRRGDHTEEFWTHDDIQGRKMPDIPLFILTAQRTFSGAEEFAYNMQSRERATLIGEVTGGGANPGGARRISDDFLLFVPTGRAINPVTGTNWEGIGVKPEIEVDADSALDIAINKATLAAETYYEAKKERIISNYQKTKALMEEATSLFDMGEVDEAEKLVFKGLKNGITHEFLDEFGVNVMGYDYLGRDKKQMAIAIFKFNTQNYPKSSNTYDSLGEAYLANGEKQLALVNYQRAFQLDPGNTNAEKIIKDLESQ